MGKIKLPAKYSTLSIENRRLVREEYIRRQLGKCYYCGSSLIGSPPKRIKKLKIDWNLFPPNFLKYPIHLQHDHSTDMTEGAVHSLCNAVMWQCEGR